MERVKTHLPAILFLLLAVTAVFGRAVWHPFVNYDDPGYVTNNPMVLKGLTVEGVVWAFRSLEVHNWHPLAWLSHMLDVSLFGADRPGAHHIVNVGLHGAVAVLLYLVLCSLTGARGPSLAAATLFALHPLRVEVVAWVAERKELLCVFFLLLAVSAYGRYARKPSTARYVSVAGLFALALLSKPMAVTFPFLLLLLDYWPLCRFPFSPVPQGYAGIPVPRLTPGRIALEKTPFVLLSAVSSLITWQAQSGGGAAVPGATIPLISRFENAVVAVVSYLWKSLVPAGLGPYYPHPALLHVPIPAWKWGGGLLLLAGATLLIVRSRASHPFLAVGWLWFLGALAPVAGLVQVGGQAMADRYTYLPSIGLSMGLAWAGSSILGATDKGRKAGFVATGIASVILAVTAFVQTGYWRSSSVLFERAISAGGEYVVPLDLLAEAYTAEGRHADAARAYERSIRQVPGNPLQWMNLGSSLESAGDFEKAVDAYREAMRLSPRIVEIRGRLAVALARTGNHREALSVLPDGNDLTGANLSPYSLLASHYEKNSRYELAASVYEAILRRDPRHAEAWNNLGVDYGALGKYDLAYRAFLRAVALRPNWGEAWYNAGVSAALGGRRQEARKALASLSAVDPALGSALASFLAKGK